MKRVKNYLSLSVALAVLTFVSGCACNRNFTEGFIKGAAIGGAVGGAEGYILSDTSSKNSRNTLKGAAIGGLFGGIIGGFINRCDTVEIASVKQVDLDSDGDGVPDHLDQCPDTPPGVKVDHRGCPIDSDGDGVPDYLDKCPDTPKGVKVDARGCPIDSDGDGVPDYLDKCPNTPKGVEVDAHGCPIDSDGDGVPDYLDKCPGTPEGARVNKDGCWVIDEIEDVLFDLNSATIRQRERAALDDVVAVLNKTPDLKVEIQGHTCNLGTAAHNMSLSERRAKAVADYLVSKGISRDRVRARGYGLTRPTASNDTDEGRKLNRRVEIEPVD